MNWVLLSQYAETFLTIVLVVRLLCLRLHRVYIIFAIFLGYGLLQSLVQLVEVALRNSHMGYLDYRVTWLLIRPFAWMLSLWMVHSLLAAILRKLPGISRLSNSLFQAIFLGAAGLALLTAIPEYINRGTLAKGVIDRAMVLGLALERATSIAAILVLMAMLIFILWFPVEMPRNLAVFSGGMVVYFAAKTTLLLMLTYLPQFYSLHREPISIAISYVLAGCLAYWSIFIDSRGELRQVRLGHSWQASEQHKLIGQLEAINAALLATRRQA